MIGAYLNDAISPRAAFGIGKGIAALACVLIAFTASPLHFHALFLMWGLGVGIYDGSDFLAAKSNSSSSWATLFKKVEILGFYGSILSFVLGGIIFSKFGFAAIFLSNAIVSALVPILLLWNSDNTASSKSVAKKLHVRDWLSDFSKFPLFATLSYAFATVALKAGMIEVQQVLMSSGVGVQWNGWIFVAFTLLAFALIRLKPNQMNALLFIFLLCAVVSTGFGLSTVAIGIAAIGLTILLRVSHKVVFFSQVANTSKPASIGRDTSLGQVVAGGLLLVGSHNFNHASLMVLILATIGAVSTAKLAQMKWSTK